MKRRLALPALLALLAAPAPARGQDEAEVVGAGAGGDYQIDNRRWNGLSTLTALARGLGWEVEQVERVDWSELGKEDVIFLLYPTRKLQPSHMVAFLRGGGRVLLGDDFGQSTSTLAKLGVLRDEASGVAAERFYDDLPYAPIARPVRPGHPLAAGVEEITGNHPAVLPEVDGPQPVFAFGPGEAAIAAGSLDDGRFVIMSDPSMLINRMLEFQGNLDFAINLLRFLGRPKTTRRLVILTGDVRFRGEPRGLSDEGPGGTLANMLRDFNRFIDEDVNAYLLTEAGVRLVALIAGLGAALACALFLPLARTTELDGGWTRAGSGGDSDFESVVAAFDRERPRQSFLLPAAVIRDTVNTKLARVLEQPEPLYSLRQSELLARLEAARGEEAARALRPLLPLLRALPTRAQAASPFEASVLPKKDFERLYDGTARFYRSLGEG